MSAESDGVSRAGTMDRVCRGLDESFFRHMVGNFVDGIICINKRSNIVYVNTAVCRIFGWEAVFLVGSPLSMLMPGNGHGKHEGHIMRFLQADNAARYMGGLDGSVTGRHRDGRKIDLSVTIMRGLNSGEQVCIAVLRDISDQLAKQRELADLARTDPLTGVLNRRGFVEQFSLLCSEGVEPLSIVVMDLDHFKSINDNHGHDAGDCVLRQFAKILKEFVRPCDIVARLGGEEFAVVFADTSPDNAVQIAERIRVGLERWRFSTRHLTTLAVTVSAGVAAATTDLATSLQKADAALYQAKRRGRNMVVSG